jgi:hypothetical protein
MSREIARPPLTWGGKITEHIRLVAQAIRDVIENMPSAGEFSTVAATTTTTVVNVHVNARSSVVVYPRSANAAAQPTQWIEAQDMKFVVHHAAHALTGVDYSYIVANIL